MIQAITTTNEIMQLFEQYGNEDYDGGPVSLASHMIQCAMLAIKEDADEELITGALLHDIGHLLKQGQITDATGKYGVVKPAVKDANFLHKRGFSQRVCAVVGLQAQAIRFLAATVASYKDHLSPADLQGLTWQGGPMLKHEAEAFRLHPFFDDIIRIRNWEEEAKDPEAELLPLSYFRYLFLQHKNISKNSMKDIHVSSAIGI